MFKVHSKLHCGWLKSNAKLLKKTSTSTFTPLQACIFSIVKEYKDVLYCNQVQAKEDDLKNVAALHAMNHIFKNRDLIMNNNAKIKKEEILNRQVKYGYCFMYISHL